MSDLHKLDTLVALVKTRLIWLSVALCLAAWTGTGAAEQPPVCGIARVVDGDGIVIDSGLPVRLAGPLRE